MAWRESWSCKLLAGKRTFSLLNQRWFTAELILFYKQIVYKVYTALYFCIKHFKLSFVWKSFNRLLFKSAYKTTQSYLSPSLTLSFLLCVFQWVLTKLVLPRAANFYFCIILNTWKLDWNFCYSYVLLLWL